MMEIIRRFQEEKDMEKRGIEELNMDSLEDHLPLDKIRIQMQTMPGFLAMQKWLVIYNLIVHPRPLSQIAMHIGLSESTVYRIIADYKRLGPEALNSNKPIHAAS
jgi:hypothetical protein